MRSTPVVLGLGLLLISACASRTSGRDGPPGGHHSDGGPLRDGEVVPDGGLGPVNPCNPGCGPTELCGDTGDGNGLDDNCNGSVDEGCPCAATGTTRPCFAGAPDRRSIGACADGIEQCDEFLQWSPCTGGVEPTAETCNGTDDDCDGVTDNNVTGCASELACPATGSAAPLSTYNLRGTGLFSGTATGWHWTIGCPATVPADLCPMPADPNAIDTSVYFTASGAYRVNFQVTKPDGSTVGCTWTVYVQGTGLRVELNWDTQRDTEGGTDVDLHLHRWTTNGVDTDFFSGEDCFYGNCTPAAGGPFGGEIMWTDHMDSDLSNCSTAPHGGGAAWTARGSCRNPRLDVDTNGIDGACSAAVTDPDDPAFCAPENINVDDPIVGMPYRVLVNYYDKHTFTGPMTLVSVNIYCGGAIRAAFGLDPLVFLRNSPGYGPQNDSWHVADVVFFRGACGMDCMVYPLGDIVMGEATGDPFNPYTLPFGRPWSCNYDGAETCTP